jgi:RNA polymerase sigma-70 factor (sigma-E family)
VVDDPPGFREFVVARSPALLRTAWLLTGDAQLAEDLLQSALARTWPHWHRVATGQPEAYVWRVMVNLQSSWWRRRWRGETSTADVPDEARSIDAFPTVDDRLVLTTALRSLPVRQRQAVVLRHYHDLSESQVADLMGCSAGTVKSQTAKGISKLRAALESDHVPADTPAVDDLAGPVSKGTSL